MIESTVGAGLVGESGGVTTAADSVVEANRVIQVSAVALLRQRAETRESREAWEIREAQEAQEAQSMIEVLTVRKRGTTAYQFPGGKPEAGETSVAAALRELAEEIGVQLTEASLRRIGTFRAPAANEIGATVEAEVFAVDWDGGTPPAAAEIEECRWAPLGTATVTPEDQDTPLAPLMLRVFPAIAADHCPGQGNAPR